MSFGSRTSNGVGEENSLRVDVGLICLDSLKITDLRTLAASTFSLTAFYWLRV